MTSVRMVSNVRGWWELYLMGGGGGGWENSEKHNPPQQQLLKAICKVSHRKILKRVLPSNKVQCSILKTLLQHYCPPKIIMYNLKAITKNSCPRKLHPPFQKMVCPSCEDPKRFDIYCKFHGSNWITSMRESIIIISQRKERMSRVMLTPGRRWPSTGGKKHAWKYPGRSGLP